MHVYCNGEQAARPLDSASGVVVVVAYENGLVAPGSRASSTDVPG